jgi:hypothetical protein
LEATARLRPNLSAQPVAGASELINEQRRVDIASVRFFEERESAAPVERILSGR